MIIYIKAKQKIVLMEIYIFVATKNEDYDDARN